MAHLCISKNVYNAMHNSISVHWYMRIVRFVFIYASGTCVHIKLNCIVLSIAIDLSLQIQHSIWMCFFAVLSKQWENYVYDRKRGNVAKCKSWEKKKIYFIFIFHKYKAYNMYVSSWGRLNCRKSEGTAPKYIHIHRIDIDDISEPQATENC